MKRGQTHSQRDRRVGSDPFSVGSDPFSVGSDPFSRAEELLFACARAPGPGLKRDAINSLLARGVDIGYFSLLAVNHHVASLAYNALKSCAPVPPSGEEIIRSLKARSLAISAANSFYKKELMNILAAFAEKDIPVIPLKGICLSEYLYGDDKSRDTSVDIDLLVKEEALDSARSLLEDIGYAFKSSEEIDEYRWSHNFVKPGMPAIDLHWDITMMVRSRERIDGFWRGVKNRDSALFFMPEELLLYLSAHMVNSGAFRQLRHVRDIERLIERYANEINWDSVVSKARAWRLTGSLYTALVLIRQSLKAGLLPPHPANWVWGRNDNVKWEILRQLKISLPKRIFIRFFADKKVIMGSGSRRRLLDFFLSYTFFEIVEARSLKDHIDILRRIFFPPRKIVGDSGYFMRIIKGAAKLTRHIGPRFD
jgi:hypothetical protein